jgi:pimeloyl-ACP methyl ester carboxylesterase
MMRDPDIREATADIGSGTKLHYAEAGNGQGPTLLLLHGYTDSWQSFRLVIPLLAQTGRVVALDLRGHGDSSAPHGDYSITRMAQDVAAFMDRLGLGIVTLVGHSMGSFVARRVIRDYPDLIDRLVLVGSPVTLDNAVVRGLQEEIEQFEDWVPEEFVEAFQTSCVYRPELLPDGFLRSCIAASRRTPLHVWRATLHGMLNENYTEGLSEITQPSLIIGGCQDTVFSVREQVELAGAIRQSRLRLYRHTGHSPHWEEPRRFVEEVEDFVGSSD